MPHPSKLHLVFLSRRNLLTLLSKLDRQAQGEATSCTIIKNDNQHPIFAQSMESIMVTAVEDGDYYTDRSPGGVYPSDDPIRQDPDRGGL